MNQSLTLSAWGFIGLGLLGSAMARRIMQQGIPVVGFDIDPTTASEFREAGGRVQETTTQVTAACRLVSLCLPNGQIAAQVVDEIGEGWPRGTIVLDHTTMAPEESVAIAAGLKQHGVDYLEANVAGSSQQAEAGEALMLLGGDESIYQSVQTKLERLSDQVFYLGESGSAARMKLIFNHVLGLHRAVLAEALGLASRQGMELDQVLSVLKAGASSSNVMSIKGPNMIARDYEPKARLAQHLKDVRLILAWGEQVGAQLPLQSAHEKLLERAIELGFADADNSAVFESYLSDD